MSAPSPPPAHPGATGPGLLDRWKKLSTRAKVLVVVGAVVVIGAISSAVDPDSTSPDALGSATTSTTPNPAAPSAPRVTPSAPRTTAPPVIPDDQVFEGRGAKVIPLDLAEGFVHLATITHDGRRNFAIWSVDEDGGNLDLIVNEIGRYNGTRPLNLRDDPAALKVEADGNWKITVHVAQKAPRWTGDSSGTGSAVLLVEPGVVQGLTTVDISHNGDSNFVIWAYGARDTDLLVNEIGDYSGETILPTWTVLLEIEADGGWRIAKS